MIRFVLRFPAGISRARTEAYLEMWRAADAQLGQVDVALGDGVTVERIAPDRPRLPAIVRRARAQHR